MPERAKGEPLKKYVARCIKARRNEHSDEQISKSVAACYSMGRTWWQEKK